MSDRAPPASRPAAAASRNIRATLAPRLPQVQAGIDVPRAWHCSNPIDRLVLNRSHGSSTRLGARSKDIDRVA